MKVHDIMSSPPQTCCVASDLATASRRMKQTATGMLVAFDGRNRIAGVVTDRDLALAIGSSLGDVRARPVREVMSCPVRTCREEDDLHDALRAMTTAHVRRLPVVSADGDLKGVLSVDDILLWAVQRRGVGLTELLEALRRICLPRPAQEDPAMPRL